MEETEDFPRKTQGIQREEEAKEGEGKEKEDAETRGIWRKRRGEGEMTGI